MLKEFKNFIAKGNVVDMAVGVVIGSAFGAIVTSLVNDIIMPIVGVLTSGIDLKDMKLVLSRAVIEAGEVVKPEVAISYGSFIQAVVNFLIIAVSVFAMVKIVSKLHRKPNPEPEAPKGPTSEELLAEIRDLLKKD